MLRHHVRIAHDGRSGMAAAKASAPDVVLCDLGLPDVSGYEVARALRAEPSLAGARLVALSGYAVSEDQQRAVDAGFETHLAKPTSPEQLEEVLRESTGGRARSRRDRASQVRRAEAGGRSTRRAEVNSCAIVRGAPWRR